MKGQRNIYTALLQIMVLISILLILPLMIYVFTGNPEEGFRSFIGISPALVISFIIFMLNYWWLVPRFYYRQRRPLFFLLNLAIYCLIILWSFSMWTTSVGDPHENVFLFATTLFITFMFLVGAAALALAFRNSIRNKMLRDEILEEKRRHTEAELVWLKNQINPHFLFNTLNNISALIALDPDEAQECISKLSDLMRYAMYETSKPFVSLVHEVNFMKDYISLMKLRCNDKTVVSTDFEINSPAARIAPLLLVSLIENAFKHGVSSNQPSHIYVEMKENDGKLTFKCCNSNHAKGHENNSGSGIGLANMHRRLDLLYKDKYQWHQEENDDIFSITITIEL